MLSVYIASTLEASVAILGLPLGSYMYKANFRQISTFGTQKLGQHPELTINSTCVTNIYPWADLAIKWLGMVHDTLPKKIIA